MAEYNFRKALEVTLLTEGNSNTTENGAIGDRTSGNALLDINFAVSSLRNMSEEEIEKMFVKAFYEDRALAMRWLFFASDVRKGLGERRLFRVLLKYLAINHGRLTKEVLSLVPEYNRWDNLWCLLDTELKEDVLVLVKEQLAEDENNMVEGKNVSLLAKWLPSINTSSKKSRELAKQIADGLGMTNAEYRKRLSGLRSYLNVIEVDMSRNTWENIEYEKVPSRANLLYRQAFFRHDPFRRKEYLTQLALGNTTIHSGVLFPQDIVHAYYGESGWRCKLKGETDEALEALWKALPDYAKGDTKTICVVDGSGSMSRMVGRTEVTCHNVADALAIYFAERLGGEFKDTFITFSKNPQLVSVREGKTLREKLEIVDTYTEVANTNIEAVFELILSTAVNAGLSQEELPRNILILSDMEFDGCACNMAGKKCDLKLFQSISEKYRQFGYRLPRLVFWNICSRTRTIPIRENELGVALVSGFSPTIMDMVLSNETDPFVCLKKKLESKRYDAVGQAVERVTV